MRRGSPGQLPWEDSLLQLSHGQGECPLQQRQQHSGTIQQKCVTQAFKLSEITSLQHVLDYIDTCILMISNMLGGDRHVMFTLIKVPYEHCSIAIESLQRLAVLTAVPVTMHIANDGKTNSSAIVVCIL